jgi:hypothetical protein
MTNVLSTRSLTISELVEGGILGATAILSQAETSLVEYFGEGENRKGYLLAMCAALIRRLSKDTELEMAFMGVMASRKTTVPAQDGTGDKRKQVNEYLYYLRTLFGKVIDGKWVSNRTYENWAGPLRYLLSLELEEIQEFMDIITQVEAKKGNKTYRRIEALRILDWGNFPPAKRDSGDKQEDKPSQPVELPVGVLRVKPLASFTLAADALPTNDDQFALAVVRYQDGVWEVLYGVPETDQVVRVAAESYRAQKDRLTLKPKTVPFEKVEGFNKLVAEKTSEDA